jgi:hypothetical protein
MPQEPNNYPGELQPSPAFREQEPKKLDLGKLELVRRWSQYAAVAVLVIFIALFVAGSIQLNKIYASISQGKKTLDQQSEQIKLNDLKIKSQEEKIKRQDTTIKTLLNPAQPLDREQRQQVLQIVETSVDQSGGEKKITARIYVQIGDENQRKRATEAVHQLQKKGYIVPGIENVGGKARLPNASELRYFETDSVTRGDIKDIVETLGSMGIEIEVPKNPLNSSGVRPRHYELWFGRDF